MDCRFGRLPLARVPLACNVRPAALSTPTVGGDVQTRETTFDEVLPKADEFALGLVREGALFSAGGQRLPRHPADWETSAHPACLTSGAGSTLSPAWLLRGAVHPAPARLASRSLRDNSRIYSGRMSLRCFLPISVSTKNGACS